MDRLFQWAQGLLLMMCWPELPGRQSYFMISDDPIMLKA